VSAFRAYRADIVVGETVILEIKSIEQLLPVRAIAFAFSLRPTFGGFAKASVFCRR
jgi:hypothetical protein